MTGTGTLGGRILQARLNLSARLGHQVTQQEIADKMKVTGVTVGRWENNVKEPDLATIDRLAAVLEVSPAWLAFGIEPNGNPVPSVRQPWHLTNLPDPTAQQSGQQAKGRRRRKSGGT